MNLNELIQRISFIRTRANLSARQLSLQIGKTSSYIARLEQSHSFAPTFETLIDILESCNSSTEEFFYHNIAQYKNDMELLNLLKNSNTERKQLALNVLKVK